MSAGNRTGVYDAAEQFGEKQGAKRDAARRQAGVLEKGAPRLVLPVFLSWRHKAFYLLILMAQLAQSSRKSQFFVTTSSKFSSRLATIV
jgi:hypothetical protein